MDEGSLKLGSKNFQKKQIDGRLHSYKKNLFMKILLIKKH